MDLLTSLAESLVSDFHWNLNRIIFNDIQTETLCVAKVDEADAALWLKAFHNYITKYHTKR